MNKIEQIELFISDWKAAEEQDKALGRHKQARYAKGRQDGLAAALAIFKRPSNTAIQIDKKPCYYCLSFADGSSLSNFCSNCGKAFYD